MLAFSCYLWGVAISPDEEKIRSTLAGMPKMLRSTADIKENLTEFSFQYFSTAFSAQALLFMRTWFVQTDLNNLSSFFLLFLHFIPEFLDLSTHWIKRLMKTLFISA